MRRTHARLRTSLHYTARFIGGLTYRPSKHMPRAGILRGPVTRRMGGLSVKGRSRSLDMVDLPLDRSHTISYWPSIISLTMFLSCKPTVSEI